MKSEQPKGPFCQSCSMPMGKPDDFGTDIIGYKVNDYCHYCYKDGRFTDPDIIMEQMIDLAVSCMVKHENIPEEKAEEIASSSIPRLKRWKKDD